MKSGLMKNHCKQKLALMIAEILSPKVEKKSEDSSISSKLFFLEVQ